MTDLDGLIDLIPINDIAKQLGIEPSVAKATIKRAARIVVGFISVPISR